MDKNRWEGRSLQFQGYYSKATYTSVLKHRDSECFSISHLSGEFQLGNLITGPSLVG